MEDIVAKNDNQSHLHHDVVRNENESKPSHPSGMTISEDRYNRNDIANTSEPHADDGTIQLPPHTNENNATMTNENTADATTTNAGGSTHDAYNNDEEFTTVSMSPDERNTFYPSSSYSRRTSSYEPQQYYNPRSDDHLRHPTSNIVRPSRESVLQRLCEALLRRSLTKVRVLHETKHVVPYLRINR